MLARRQRLIFKKQHMVLDQRSENFIALRGGNWLAEVDP